MTNQPYYAKGPGVFQRPSRNVKTGAIRLGFRVCTVSDGLDQDAAELIAEALNSHDPLPDGYEVAT